MKLHTAYFHYFGRKVGYEYVEYESLEELPIEVLVKFNKKVKLEAMKKKETEVIGLKLKDDEGIMRE